MANYAKKLEIWINCKYLDKSDVENCRFNGKPCEKIRDLDKLHKHVIIEDKQFHI